MFSLVIYFYSQAIKYTLVGNIMRTAIFFFCNAKGMKSRRIFYHLPFMSHKLDVGVKVYMKTEPTRNAVILKIRHVRDQLFLV